MSIFSRYSIFIAEAFHKRRHKNSLQSENCAEAYEFFNFTKHTGIRSESAQIYSDVHFTNLYIFERKFKPIYTFFINVKDSLPMCST